MEYRFEDFQLDTDLRCLVRDGQALRLQPKVFELFELLLLHRGRVVPKALLLRELWPEAVVTGASLTRVVKEARRVLGDDGRSQRVIRTYHGFGYRFAAEVHTVAVSGATEAERAIALARRSLEAALEMGARDLHERVQDFVDTCLRQVQQSAMDEATG